MGVMVVSLTIFFLIESSLLHKLLTKKITRFFRSLLTNFVLSVFRNHKMSYQRFVAMRWLIGSTDTSLGDKVIILNLWGTRGIVLGLRWRT